MRYGNVLGSRGSVVPILLRQKDNNEFFTITDKRMTRFNITLDEAVIFVLKSIDRMKGGEIFVPKIPSYRILDLVRAINEKKKIKYIGIRPGEKLHEEMISSTDAINASEHKNYYVIHPSYQVNYSKKPIKNFSSDNNSKFLSSKELIKIIKKNQSSFEKDE